MKRNGIGTGQPAADVLREQGRSQAWLAGRMRYSAEYVNRVLRGREPATDEFCRRCADVLHLPEGLLFRDRSVLRNPADTEAVA